MGTGAVISDGGSDEIKPERGDYYSSKDVLIEGSRVIIDRPITYTQI